jgi:hypothetical protein
MVETLRIEFFCNHRFYFVDLSGTVGCKKKTGTVKIKLTHFYSVKTSYERYVG